MKFKTVAEAFNFYRTKTVEEMQTRAAQIATEIETNADADIDALNIELSGIKEARDNADSRSAAKRTLSVLESMKTETRDGFNAENVFESEEYRSAFFKTMLNQKLSDAEKRAFALGMEVAEKRNDAYNTASNSAAVLPTATLNEIIKKARTMGGLLGEARAFNIPTKISIPIGTPATKAAWHTEAAAVDSDNVTVASVAFDGYEIMKVFSISEKVRKMSIAAFESYIVDELNACVMELLDYAIINGDGDGEGTGIESGITWVKTAGATQNEVEVAAASDLKYADVVSVVALLKRGYAAGAKWAMNNKTLYTYFYTLADDTGRPLFISDPKSETIGKILGFDVVIDDNIADGKAYLGNFGKYLGYNLPEGIVIESSRESSFKKGVVDYRAMAIADCKPLVTEAFVRLHKKQS